MGEAPRFELGTRTAQAIGDHRAAIVADHARRRPGKR
jgi:hypothetical protein